MSLIWAWTSERNVRAKRARAGRLNTPVISVGGITMGGAGKTPLVNYLAERLNRLGAQPAILTRGYRRRSIEPSILIEAGHPAPVSVTGDEAQMFVVSGQAHLGIGADRLATGRLLEEKLHPGVFLLDDGFQHVRLARDLDLVAIDALIPFGGGSTFPLGALREPMSGLERASAFVIMRAAREREYRGLVDQLRAWNAHAPIFRARLEPRGWVNYMSRVVEQPACPVAAFCGLANPSSFWATLRALRMSPDFHWSFDDHHPYSCTELERLADQARAHGSRVLLTTQKDAMNLPESAPGVLEHYGVSLYWLKIGVQIEQEDRLLELIESKLRTSALAGGQGS
jgi:tetraacyldisaccharide 4'-kinase